MNIEGLSLDQVRAVISVVEAGSFSAAARRFHRAQSAVSYAVMSLEQQLGITLFDRRGHKPALTPAGQALLPELRGLVAQSERLQAQARAIAGGLEPELRLVVDAVYPTEHLAEILSEFTTVFPTVRVRLYGESLGGVARQVLDSTADLGLQGTLPNLPPGLTSYALPPMHMIPLAAPTHPLAQIEGEIPKSKLADHVQLVLTDRSELTKGQEFFVLSPRTWRLADLGAKHAFLRAGLGWGTMPSHSVVDDLARGRLKELKIPSIPEEGDAVPVFAVHREQALPGPATRWFIERLRTLPRR